jgi:hypothetical protein
MSSKSFAAFRVTEKQFLRNLQEIKVPDRLMAPLTMNHAATQDPWNLLQWFINTLTYSLDEREQVILLPLPLTLSTHGGRGDKEGARFLLPLPPRVGVRGAEN